MDKAACAFISALDIGPVRSRPSSKSSSCLSVIALSKEYLHHPLLLDIMQHISRCRGKWRELIGM